MSSLSLAAIKSPFRVGQTGVVRIGKTRVTLDTLMACYRDGNTAEEIVEQFPVLAMADVHAAIAYYLNHRREVDAYIQDRQRSAAEIRRQAEAISDQRGIRERLLARPAARKMRQ